MKKLLLLTFMLAFLANIKGQSYIPFPMDSAIWSVSNIKFSIYDDTTINTKVFHKCYYQSGIVDFNFERSNANYIGAIREENKQIFIISKDSVNEFLVYDFTKGVGDTIVNYSFDFLPYSFNLDPNITIIESIDSIMIHSEYRKRYKIKLTSSLTIAPPEYIIEGIGSTNGLFFSGYYNHNIADRPMHELLCFEKNKIILYQNSASCFYYSNVGIESIANHNKNDVFINPNPFIEETIITIPDDLSMESIYTLTIYNSNGKIAKVINSCNSEISLKRDNLEKGFYYLTIMKNGYFLSSKKIIIL